MLTSMCTTVTVSPFPLFLLLGRKGCGDFVVVGWYTGVEGAFSCSPSVLTVSFYKHDLGFFPGSGGLGDTGKGGGKYCAVNVPLKGGMNRASFVPLFTSVMEAAKASFSPEAVVFQCGADALAGDPTRAFNLSSECYAACLRLVLRWSLPTLVLGGGGYNHCNTAKCWTLLTAVCLEERQQRHDDGKGESVSRSENAVLAGLSEDLPEHDLLSEYAGDYSLPVREGMMKNENTPENLQALLATVVANLEKLGQAQAQDLGQVDDSEGEEEEEDKSSQEALEESEDSVDDHDEDTTTDGPNNNKKRRLEESFA